MKKILFFIAIPLGWAMFLCYNLTGSYAFAIVLFTVLTKLILMPVALWVQKNGIKIVRIQPELNKIKADFFGDKNRVADETAALYKKEKYNPFSNIIPMFLQILLLIGLIQVIYNPLTHLLRFDSTLIESLIKMTGSLTGVNINSSSIQLTVVEAIKNSAYTGSFLAVEGVNIAVIEAVRSINMGFLGLNFTLIPSQTAGLELLIPVLAGLAALALSLAQNKLNPLQAEQTKAGQWGTMAFSVGISLFLGAFVPVGVGFYWIFSNLFTIPQQLLLNVIINPKKHINFEKLEASKKALAALEAVGKKKPFEKDQHSKREKADYKRFFSIANKHLVFYSESSGFYKYYEKIIEELLKRSNVIIHYITSDPDDAIFKQAVAQPRIKPYYIGPKRLITLMMKMDADMVVMTMPDLGNYHIKRSYVRKDTEYVYLFHYPLSTHMVLPKGALDNYDTILCVGEFQFEEIRKMEELYDLSPKKLIACGYGQLDKLYDAYKPLDKSDNVRKKILIAPSWQKDNILDTCIEGILDSLIGKGFDIIVRPHPEYVKRFGPRMDAVVAKYQDNPEGDLTFELDFSGNSSIFEADLVITDWSGTAYEFSFITCKPSVFIDTTPKTNNPEYTKLGIEPLEFSLRDKIGIRINPSELSSLLEKINQLIVETGKYKKEILEMRSRYISNFGQSGEVGCRYILDSLKAMTSANKK